jgi:glycine cleavage system H protein
MYPQDCRYSKDHEWIKVEGDRGRVGITDYAQKQLGDVVFLELPALGRSLKEGEQFGTVESVNAALTGKPEAINKDPHGEAWMIVLKIADPAAVAALLDAAAYQSLVDSEAK